MPRPQRDWQIEGENPLISEQLDYNCEAEWEKANARISLFNANQKYTFDPVINSIENSLGKTFFLHGPGGTGKTFVYNTLCFYLRAHPLIVLCAASSGIAALLIQGGCTAHQLFKIPVENIGPESFCNIPKQSQHADLLRAASLIIWDEALMQHRHTHKALDRTLHDL
uniref:ATP-dependent DNA helicase n=1 Tax=Moniliophthora roreri TaxID=221103 RepID=A0A0W0GEY7_MONRR